MTISHEVVISEAEEGLRGSSIELPLGWMIDFILSYAETGEADPDELQELADEIRARLEDFTKNK